MPRPHRSTTNARVRPVAWGGTPVASRPSRPGVGSRPPVTSLMWKQAILDALMAHPEGLTIPQVAAGIELGADRTRVLAIELKEQGLVTSQQRGGKPALWYLDV
jgi:hypothetical protein